MYLSKDTKLLSPFKAQQLVTGYATVSLYPYLYRMAVW